MSDTPITTNRQVAPSATLGNEVRVVRSSERRIEVGSGAMTRFEGVSSGLTGAQGIHLAIATIPPREMSSPHRHINCESAIFVLSGQGRFLVGEQLERSIQVGPGDFIYIPPMAVHAPTSDSDEPLELLVARNAPVEEVEEVSLPSNAR
jgi:uncharacterized RmlC-like cupin family protein